MTVRGESLVLAGTAPGNLTFDGVVPGTLAVRSTYKADDPKCVVYKEGEDYVVNLVQGTLARTENSKMPDFARNVLYGQKDFDHGKFPGFTNHPFFVWVDYTTTHGQPWAKANDQTPFLAKTRARLAAGGPFRIVSYGDSITAGGEASEPDLRFQAMYGKYLQGKFPKSKIEVEDVSISGYCSIHGIQLWDDYLGKTKPDLVLVGWGMNDHNLPGGGGVEPDAFQKNLTTLVEMIRDRKNAEVILFSAFPPNDDWHFGTHRMGLFADATKQAAIDAKCAYVDVYNTWKMVLTRKDQSSLL
ncbi:MAG: SGNH/GDSL hydrolase family protein, partial [Isosphaeraceae bacterium]